MFYQVAADSICAFQDTRSAPEPSGALAVAGMKKWIIQNNLLGKGRRFVSIVSGANLNFSRLRFISERADLGEGKEASLRVIIPEKKGALVDQAHCPNASARAYSNSPQLPQTAHQHSPAGSY